MGSLGRIFKTASPGKKMHKLRGITILVGLLFLSFKLTFTEGMDTNSESNAGRNFEQRSVLQIERRFLEIQRRFQQFHQIVERTTYNTFHVSSLNNFEKIKYFNNMMEALTK